MQVQSDGELGRYDNLPLIEFSKWYKSNKGSSTLMRHTLKSASGLGTKNCYEQLFSKLSIAKSILPSRLSNTNWKNSCKEQYQYDWLILYASPKRSYSSHHIRDELIKCLTKYRRLVFKLIICMTRKWCCKYPMTLGRKREVSPTLL